MIKIENLFLIIINGFQIIGFRDNGMRRWMLPENGN